MFCAEVSPAVRTRKLQLDSLDCNSHEMRQRNLSGMRYQEYQIQQKHYFHFEDKKKYMKKSDDIYMLSTLRRRRLN